MFSISRFLQYLCTNHPGSAWEIGSCWPTHQTTPCALPCKRCRRILEEAINGSYLAAVRLQRPDPQQACYCTLHDPLDESQKSPSIALLLRCSRDSTILIVIRTGRIALEQATVRISTIIVKWPSLNYRTPYGVVHPEASPLGKRHRCRSRGARPMERERTHDSS